MQMTADGCRTAVDGLCQQLQRNGSSQGFGIDVVGQGFIDCEGTFAELLTIGVTDGGIQMKSLGTGRLRTELLHDTLPSSLMGLHASRCAPPVCPRWAAGPRSPTTCSLILKSKICARYEQGASARHDRA